MLWRVVLNSVNFFVRKISQLIKKRFFLLYYVSFTQFIIFFFFSCHSRRIHLENVNTIIFTDNDNNKKLYTIYINRRESMIEIISLLMIKIHNKKFCSLFVRIRLRCTVYEIFFRRFSSQVLTFFISFC